METTNYEVPLCEVFLIFLPHVPCVHVFCSAVCSDITLAFLSSFLTYLVILSRMESTGQSSSLVTVTIGLGFSYTGCASLHNVFCCTISSVIPFSTQLKQ